MDTPGIRRSTRTAPVALGTLSMALGCVGTLLFFMPVLGLPLGAFGLLFGVIGAAASILFGGEGLVSSFRGCAISALALAINLSIAWAPSGYLPQPAVEPPWQPVPDRPTVSPPARPGSMF